MKNPKTLVMMMTVFSFLALIPLFSQIKVQAAPKSEKAIEVQTSKEEKGPSTAETHQSVVATFVQDLLSVADRNRGIGESVKVIAQEQNDSQKEVTEKIDTVEKRSKIKTFLIGSDYKNLGALRSEMVKTNNHLNQLKRLIDKTTNTVDKTALQNQITALEQEQAKINNFITQNENKFSLFGWAAKLLNK